MLICNLALDRSFLWFSGSSAFRLQETPEVVNLRPSRSEEVRGSLELHKGGLRVLEEAWMTTFCLRHFSVKSGRFLCSRGASRWCQEVSSSVQGGLRMSREV